MKKTLALFSMFFMIGTSTTQAAPSDAREVARINNCPPKKIEVFQQTLGIDGKTVYRIDCNMPKTKEEKTGPSANAILVQCHGSLCGLLRTIGNDEK